MAATAPDAAGRDLDHRHEPADGVPERRGVAIRPALGEALADRAGRLRALGQQRQAGGEDLVDVQPGQGLRERAVAPLALDDRLDERPDFEAISGRDEVDRRSHQHHGTDDPSLLEICRELERVEVGDARPERRVRVGRHLRLHPDQALDHIDRGHAFAPEQELALQDGAIELPPRERPRRQPSGCQIAVSWPNAMR